jgi:peptide/nickel transport system permease protein
MKINKTKRQNSHMQEIWRKLKINKVAMASLIVIIIILFVAAFGTYLAPYHFAEQNYDKVLQYPNKIHLFGTDNFGRDIFSRILYGCKYTVFIGFGATILAAAFGIVLGLLAAYYKKLDNLIMRIMDVFIGMPGMTLLILIIAVLGTDIKIMVLAIAISYTPTFARVTRGAALSVINQEYIEACVAIGANSWRILFKHVLPNSLAPVIVQFTLTAGLSILLGASLSFVGMGVQQPIPEWGLMVSDGRSYLRSDWYMSIIPGLAIILVTTALNYIGDGIRDALDPRLNK